MFPGHTEWIVILLIVLIIFGGRKLPELMSGLGKGIRNLKKELNQPDAIDVTPIEDKKTDENEEDENEEEDDKKS